jgi:hypothetical protein
MGMSAWILSPLARSGTGGLSIAKHCTNFPQSSFHEVALIRTRSLSRTSQETRRLFEGTASMSSIAGLEKVRSYRQPSEFTLVHFTSPHSVSYPTTCDVRRAGPAQSCRAGSDCERSLQGHRGQVRLELELLDPARTLPRHRLTLSSLSLSPQAVHRQEAAEPSVDLQREGRVRPPR